MTSTKPAALGPTPPAPSGPQLGRVVAIAIVLGALASGAIAVASNLGEVINAVQEASPIWFVPAIGFALLAHGVKFGLWHWYLLRVTQPPERQLGLRESAAIFGTGVLMLLTPGNLGEFVKTYYVAEDGGPSPARTVPIILAERAVNMLGLVLVSIIGVFAYREAAWVVGLSAAIAFFLIGTLKSRRLAGAVTALAEGIPVLRRIAPYAEEFSESGGALLGWRSIGVLSLVSAVSWSFEAAAFVVVLHGFGQEVTWAMVNSATFAWVVATLAGGLLLVPGGLGVVEGGATGLAVTLIEPLDRSTSAAATLVTRVATLWIPAAVGVVCALWLARRTAHRTAHRRGSEHDVASATGD